MRTKKEKDRKERTETRNETQTGKRRSSKIDMDAMKKMMMII